MSRRIAMSRMESSFALGRFLYRSQILHIDDVQDCKRFAIQYENKIEEEKTNTYTNIVQNEITQNNGTR